METKDCPKTLISEATIDVSSKQDFEKEYKKSSALTDEMSWYESRREALGAVKGVRLHEVLRLLIAEKAVCRYGNTRGDSAKFYTTNGRNVVRIMTHAFQTRVGYYVNIKDYSSESIEIDDQNSSVLVETSDQHGEFSEAVKIGRTKQIKLDLQN